MYFYWQWYTRGNGTNANTGAGIDTGTDTCTRAQTLMLVATRHNRTYVDTNVFVLVVMYAMVLIQKRTDTNSVTLIPGTREPTYTRIYDSGSMVILLLPQKILILIL